MYQSETSGGATASGAGSVKCPLLLTTLGTLVAATAASSYL